MSSCVGTSEVVNQDGFQEREKQSRFVIKIGAGRTMLQPLNLPQTTFIRPHSLTQPKASPNVTISIVFLCYKTVDQSSCLTYSAIEVTGTSIPSCLR